jgi:DNA-directed RNA polymerase alpha subunit
VKDSRAVRLEEIIVPEAHRWCASRFRNFCAWQRVRTLGELADWRANDLLRHKNFGHKTLRAVKAILAEHRLELRP